MRTEYASAERKNREEILYQSARIDSIEYLRNFINTLPYIVTVLNEERQIIFSNEDFLNQVNERDMGTILGKRTGEAISCIHATDCEGGCGTSQHCKVCGAVNSILQSQTTQKKVESECRIMAGSVENPEHLNYKVIASPFRYNGDRFTIFSMIDISNQKRKESLERIFFHDILNTAGNLQGLTRLLLQQKNNENNGELLKLISDLSRDLVEEIQAQRQITLAENGELSLKIEMINGLEILDQTLKPFLNSSRKEVLIFVDEDSDDVNFYTDRMILLRILKNMVKNALEASDDGDTILAGVKESEKHMHFYVSNPAVIPEEVRLQIFQRSFSTKGEGRGLGTYSMKLLGEKYLRARIYFESGLEKGTTFRLDIPKS